ncbi:MAG TPA: GTP-binding protein [Pseudobdellovibrionaceae bacterium]|nr:GTP-binding protein [Pseudobdellovibrionaceae bacterium]
MNVPRWPSLTLIFGWRSNPESRRAHERFFERILEYESQTSTTATLIDDGHGDLLDLIEQCHRENEPQQILIDVSPVMEPGALTEFIFEAHEHDDLHYPIQNVVTWIDGPRFFPQLQSGERLRDLGLAYDEFDDRSVSDLLLEQIESADLLYVQTEGMSIDELTRLREFLDWINPRALQIEDTEPKSKDLQTDQLFGPQGWRAARETLTYDDYENHSNTGWMMLLAGDHPRIANRLQPTTSGRFHSLNFRARRPFHPDRFKELGRKLFELGMWRAKGWVWIATRHGEAGLWSMAGATDLLMNSGAWLASTPLRHWPSDPEIRDEILSDWEEPYGDRRQDIALIGEAFNEMEVRRLLKNALVTEEEFLLGPEAWQRWPDQLRDWSRDLDEDEQESNDLH